MHDKLIQFIDNVNGQFIEVSSKEAPFQCFDLAYLYNFILGYPKATIQNSSAYQIYENPKEITLKYFDLIENKLETIPQEGDIVVWGKNYGPCGHVGIVIEATQFKMKVFEQNNPLGTNAHVQDRNYTGVIGFLRPKVFDQPIITDQTRIKLIENLEVQAIRSQLYDRNNEIFNLKSDKIALNATITKLYEEMKDITAQLPTPAEKAFTRPLAIFLFNLAKVIEG